MNMYTCILWDITSSSGLKPRAIKMYVLKANICQSYTLRSSGLWHCSPTSGTNISKEHVAFITIHWLKVAQKIWLWIVTAMKTSNLKCVTLSCFMALCIDANGMLHFFACAIMLDNWALNLGSGPPPSVKFKCNIS